jgi:FAD/FMN-containing dehydrogenase
VLKRPYLEMALGPLAVEVMQGIKKALDPKGILNPGKVLPD